MRSPVSDYFKRFTPDSKNLPGRLFGKVNGLSYSSGLSVAMNCWWRLQGLSGRGSDFSARARDAAKEVTFKTPTGGATPSEQGDPFLIN